MRLLLILILLNSAMAFATETLQIDSHIIKVEPQPNGKYVRMEAFDVDGRLRLSVDKYVYYDAGYNVTLHYVFGVRAPDFESWQIQEMSADEYNLLFDYIKSTPENRFYKKFMPGCKVTVDIANVHMFKSATRECDSPPPK